jgi:hypothetical protein
MIRTEMKRRNVVGQAPGCRSYDMYRNMYNGKEKGRMQDADVEEDGLLEVVSRARTKSGGARTSAWPWQREGQEKKKGDD